MRNISRQDVIINRNRIAARRYDFVEQKAPRGAHAEVIFTTLEAHRRYGTPIQTAFRDACEEQNYHSQRKDIVEDRRQMAEILDTVFGYVVDPVMEENS